MVCVVPLLQDYGASCHSCICGKEGTVLVYMASKAKTNGNLMIEVFLSVQ